MANQARKTEEAAPMQQPPDSPAPARETPDRLTTCRPARAHLSPEETRARVEAFTTEREEAFIAAIREDEG